MVMVRVFSLLKTEIDLSLLHPCVRFLWRALGEAIDARHKFASSEPVAGT